MIIVQCIKCSMNLAAKDESTMLACPGCGLIQSQDEDANRALMFAKRHDWGQDARLSHDLSTVYMLQDRYADGRMDYVDRPASIEALREFGGY